MKYFILVICAIGAVVAQEEHKTEDKKPEHDHKGNQSHWDWRKHPGCEKADSVAKIEASQCCASLPKVLGKEIHENCTIECKTKKNWFCCHTECIIKAYNFGDSAGKFSAANAKESLKKVKEANYPIDKIIDECVEKAPKEVEEWKKKMGDKASKFTCENPENIATVKCIGREIIMNCPDWSKNADCDSLMAFGKSCPLYPHYWQGKCDKKDGKGEKKKKGGDEKKSEDEEPEE